MKLLLNNTGDIVLYLLFTDGSTLELLPGQTMNVPTGTLISTAENGQICSLTTMEIT